MKARKSQLQLTFHGQVGSTAGEGAFASDFIILMPAVVRLRHTRAKLQEPVTSLDLPWGVFQLRLSLTLIPSYSLSQATQQRCFPPSSSTPLNGSHCFKGL